MDLHLTRELEEIVQSRVGSGRYNSAAEVVGEALRLLVDRDELFEARKKQLHGKISAGLESLARGESVDGDEFFAQLEREEAGLEKQPVPA